MKKTMQRHPGILVLAGLVLIIYVSSYGLDFSAFSSLSGGMIKETIGGLFHPDWSMLYDGTSEDVLSLMLLTIEIALVGTAVGTVFAVPLSLLSASNLWPKYSPVPRAGKVILDILRSFPELVYAIIFVKMTGPGPFAGAMAIGVHQIGMLGKLFAEEMERIDNAPVEAVKSVGANAVETFFYARLPQLMPIWTSLVLNHFEIGVRSASTLGLVGAGGIGAPLIFAIQARNWDKVSIILLAVIVTVYVLDQITGHVRKRLR
ncbi:MAG: phosphonate ABC transporter, permease protein PhnE [Lactimicrobium massiliense]|nr:phosphonate ABC transporter, permease protein PhnE [Lactimicrobium massiliense]MDD6230402.1 phosphonate ABC transporter, permease protein PhnE [Lactimicrobium massiliense]MDD6561024.1 phosphonate ABC transporter, permease protein PhnE [Lactimicrobium massiliense]